jgi:hypothetical protein
MNIVKARFRNKIDQDESLSNSFTSYIEREIVAKRWFSKSKRMMGFILIGDGIEN